MSTTKIQQAFSRSSKKYDQFSGFHRQVADQLMAELERASPQAILDIGCGTGYLTGKIREMFPGVKIVGLDLAQGMLDVAAAKHHGIDWVQGDANHLPFAGSSVDLIVSNLAYQWVSDLGHALNEAKRILSPGGILKATLFGYHTCEELFQSLQQAKPAFVTSRLPEIRQVHEALGGFRNIVVDCDQHKVQFKDMQTLMAWIKSIGANHLTHQGYLGPVALSRASSFYQQRFAGPGGIAATFEVIKIYGEK